MDKSGTVGKVIIALVVIVIALLGYMVLTAPDKRTTGEMIGDAIDELPNGLDNAARQLDDRTLGEKLGDDVKDMGKNIEDSVKRTQDQ